MIGCYGIIISKPEFQSTSFLIVFVVVQLLGDQATKYPRSRRRIRLAEQALQEGLSVHADGRRIEADVDKTSILNSLSIFVLILLNDFAMVSLKLLDDKTDGLLSRLIKSVNFLGGRLVELSDVGGDFFSVGGVN